MPDTPNPALPATKPQPDTLFHLCEVEFSTARIRRKCFEASTEDASPRVVGAEGGLPDLQGAFEIGVGAAQVAEVFQHVAEVEDRVSGHAGVVQRSCDQICDQDTARPPYPTPQC